MVISGGNFKPDTLKPKEVVSLLLDDEEIEKKCEYKNFHCYILLLCHNRSLTKKPERNRPLGRPRHRWEDNIKVILKEVRCEYVEWTLRQSSGL
jgi:DNA helicase INO80